MPHDALGDVRPSTQGSDQFTTVLSLRDLQLALVLVGLHLWPPEEAGHSRQEIGDYVTGQVSREGPEVGHPGQ